MNEIIRVDEIHQYNKLIGVETLHPLVGMIDFSTVQPISHTRKLYGFYAVFLKNVCGDIKYGRSNYDYQDGTMLFVAPGQVMGAVDDGEFFQPTGHLLMFHPDLLHGTLLGKGEIFISTTDRNVSEIAYGLGFQYSQHFARFFKQNTGCTPNEYRSQITM